MTVKSPITNSTNTKLVKSIDSKFIIDGYFKTYGMDISRFLNDLTKIDQYICLDTGYMFFYPYSISGDSKFYEYLQKFDWYYMDWKWENEIAKKYIKISDQVLEIGSGKGAFLKNLKKNKISAHGLELNNKSVLQSTLEGLSVSGETIQEHSVKKSSYYDVVCSFQVIEHIYDIDPVITATLNSLKQGGKLIISVPNNDSRLLKGKTGLLNLPPHHMGLWNLTSLKSLGKYYPIKLVHVEFEPLQQYHYQWFYEEILSEIENYSNLIKRAINVILKKHYSKILRIFASKIKGHSILVVFEKNVTS